jgi:hypothetical protein
MILLGIDYTVKLINTNAFIVFAVMVLLTIKGSFCTG